MSRVLKCSAATGLVLAALAGPALASSHREAPGVTEMPKVDNTDVYAFRSYEPGRDAFVTLIANFQPDEGPGDGAVRKPADAVNDPRRRGLGEAVHPCPGHWGQSLHFFNGIRSQTLWNRRSGTDVLAWQSRGPVHSRTPLVSPEIRRLGVRVCLLL